jgi:hypothetical protein
MSRSPSSASAEVEWLAEQFQVEPTRITLIQNRMAAGFYG